VLGASRFCSEKGKQLLRNMPVSCSNLKKLLKNFVKLLEYYWDSMSNFNNNFFVINIKVQLSNKLQQIRQPLVESKWLVTKSWTVSVTIWFTNLRHRKTTWQPPFCLHTVRCPSLVPWAFPFTWGRGGAVEAGGPLEKGKALGTRLRLTHFL